MSFRLGWLRDLPDPRDYDALRLMDGRPFFSHAPAAIPDRGTDFSSVDLTRYCSPIENQGSLGSCTGQATVGLVEYLERRRHGKHLDGSRLFVYKMARVLDGLKGDTGAYIRTAMKALRVFGVPPERYWPYVVSRYEDDPPAFVFSYGQRYRTIRYYRLDGSQTRSALLRLMRSFLYSELPVVFGFLVYDFGNDKGEFRMPDSGAQPAGGHAVLAVGYDDNREIEGHKGALRIRNSWGTGWGDEGYGWLPYGYVLQGLSADFWTIFQQDYLL